MAEARAVDAALVARPTVGARRPLLSVGITTADWMHMGEELGYLEQGGADFVHIDVMDGRFCPQLTVGPAVIGALRTSLRKDVHLMIEEPLDKLQSFVAAGADVVTIHVEATHHPHRVLQALGSMKARAENLPALTRGVALNPGTAVTAVEPLLEEAELVLLLAVNPGWSGQTFAPATERRLEALRRLIEESGRQIMLGVDGGVTQQNVGSIVALGVDLIVTGSAVFNSGDTSANLKHMLDEITRVSAR